jgi:hypothetical protein
MAIRDDYRQFIVQYRRIILEKLSEPRPGAENSTTGVRHAEGRAPVESGDAGAVAPLQPALLQPAPVEAPLYCEIDIQSAEKLSSGSLLFPVWNSDERGGWCIMIKSDRDNIDLYDDYEIVGRIKSDISGPEFMSLAYQYLLNRRLDEKMLQSDWSLVESRRITRRGVLKMFLESGDAGLRQRQFLLVPDPSPWLDRIAGALFQNETLPELSV